MVERLVSLADAFAPTGGSKGRPRRSNETEAGGLLTERVAERVERLASDTRVRAFEIMGDRPRARPSWSAGWSGRRRPDGRDESRPRMLDDHRLTFREVADRLSPC